MKYQDLTPYDVNLIRSMASNLLGTTRMTCRYEALSETLLGCIYAKGFKIEPYPERLSLVIARAVVRTPTLRDSSAVQSVEEILQDIFKYLESNNLEIKKDETREPTWTNPRASWYIQHETRKYPWQW